MGMAASQARFLGLTARKSNVEYQGQQVNQARTVLANEVMGLYNEYNSVDAPTPPSKYDYVKTTYSLSGSYDNYELSNFTKINSGEYKGYYNVSLTGTEKVTKAYNKTFKNTVLSVKESEDEEGNKNLSYINFVLGTDSYTYDENDKENSNITKITGDYSKYDGLTEVMKNQGLDPDTYTGTFYSFQMDGNTIYTTEDDIKNSSFKEVEGEKKYYGSYTFDYAKTVDNEKTVNAIASITQDSSGRLQSINVLSCDDDKDLEGKQYSITTSQSDDDAGYEDAMNQYDYEKEKYEKRLQDINNKIEKIQTEDKSLELKLRQLDTEQKALSTEMESVQSVIKDTVDKLFKSDN